MRARRTKKTTVCSMLLFVRHYYLIIHFRELRLSTIAEVTSRVYTPLSLVSFRDLIQVPFQSCGDENETKVKIKLISFVELTIINPQQIYIALCLDHA